jgi:DNA-binding transcriptional ArsR family regulator
MRHVPRLLEPRDPNRSVQVELAVQVLGNRVRNEILRYLKDHPNALLADIANGVSISRHTIGPQLVALEDADVITAQPPRGQRRGRSVLYSANLAALESLINAWISYVIGEGQVRLGPDDNDEKNHPRQYRAHSADRTNLPI